MTFLDKLSDRLNQVLVWMGCVTLSFMIILSCANIFLRKVWIPVSGTFELMGYLGAVVTAFALGYTQIRRGHIAVDIVVKGFSTRVQKILIGSNCLICLVFFVLVAWQISRYATTLMRTGEVTETLRIIYYPFTYAVALGCATLAVAFLTELLKTMFSGREDEK